MMLNEITALAGHRKRRKRVGRGESSGLGRTCGRGNKGMQSRAGSGPYPLHEGGQMPIFRRIPKRGFSNYNFRTEYQVVNVGVLAERFESGATVDIAGLRKAGLVHGMDALVKLLGTGTIDRKLNISVHAASQSARELIEKAGGTLTLLTAINAAANAKSKRNSAKDKQRPPREERSGVRRRKIQQSAK